MLGSIAAGAAPPTLAHELNERQEARAVETVASRSVQKPPPLDTAIGMLLCLEARDAIHTHALTRQVLDWIVASAHSCRDERLLVDTFGF